MNKTQCPHCFTVYVISDEQLRVSQGMVRCGTCRERFQAQVLHTGDSPKFDPRNVFIEPISEQDDETVARVAEIIKQAAVVDFKLDDFDNNLNSELSIEIEEEPSNEDFQEPSTQEYEEPPTAINHNVEQLADKIEDPASEVSETEEALNTKPETNPTVNAESPLNSVSTHINNTPIDTYSESSTAIDEFASIDEDDENYAANDGQLIDEVNQLIEKKILGAQETQSTTQVGTVSDALDTPHDSGDTDILAQATPQALLSTEQAPFSLTEKSKIPFSHWLLAPILLVAGLALGGSLVYQLWLKQLISWPDDKRLQAKLAPLIEPIEKNLDQFEVTIPVRRNLSKMKLLSAQTEAHPTRSSTTLLRVSIVNRAIISQPLPWLELSLTDAEGRLVSRRSLPPKDYAYNNQIDDVLGPNELKKVTIELLKFPKQAVGYELRMLNK